MKYVSAGCAIKKSGEAELFLMLSLPHAARLLWGATPGTSWTSRGTWGPGPKCRRAWTQ